MGSSASSEQGSTNLGWERKKHSRVNTEEGMEGRIMCDDNDLDAKRRRLEVTTEAPSNVPGGDASQESANNMLGSAQDFILHIFSTGKGDSICWGLLSAEWKADPDIAMKALKSDGIAVSDLPACLKNDRNFMMKVVAHHGRHWSSLPAHFKSEPDFARAVTTFPGDLAWSILEHLPLLCSDRDFWMKLIEAEVDELSELVQMKAPKELCCDRAFWMELIEAEVDELSELVQMKAPRELCSDRDFWMKLIDAKVDGLSELVEVKAPREIRADRDVMLSACIRDTETFQFIDESLWLDKGFVKSVLTSDEWGNAFAFVPPETQYKWPDLIIESLSTIARNFPHQSIFRWERRARSIGTDLWWNRDVVIAWFTNGGIFVSDLFPEDWREDKEIFLMIAEHCRHSEASFCFVSQNLTRDKVFMLQVVEFNCQLFFKASKELQQDFDFVVAALAGSGPLSLRSSMAYIFFRGQRHDLEFVESVRIRVQSKLVARDVFMKVVLPGMSLGTGACCLTLLTQGTETEIGYKKLIAEYLGVPIGKEHHLLRRAAVNLPDSDVIYEAVKSDDESSLMVGYH